MDPVTLAAAKAYTNANVAVLGGIPAVEKGAASGVATLDANGFLAQRPDRAYATMPTQAQLEADMAADQASGISRDYVLPNGTLQISGELGVLPGCRIVGQGYRWASVGGMATWESGTLIQGTNATAQVLLNKQSGIVRCGLEMAATATAPILAQAAMVGLVEAKDLLVFGGPINGGVFAVSFPSPYEADVHNIRMTVRCSGFDIPFDGLFNPGDATISQVRIALLDSTDSIGFRMSGNQAGSQPLNNLVFNDCYVQAAQVNGGNWQAASNIGIDIINASKIVFTKMNVEQLATALRVRGQVGTGSPSATSRITFVGGWLYENVEIGSGVTDVVYVNTNVTGTVTGDGKAAFKSLGAVYDTAAEGQYRGTLELCSTAVTVNDDSGEVQVGEKALAAVTVGTTSLNGIFAYLVAARDAGATRAAVLNVAVGDNGQSTTNDGVTYRLKDNNGNVLASFAAFCYADVSYRRTQKSGLITAWATAPTSSTVYLTAEWAAGSPTNRTAKIYRAWVEFWDLPTNAA